MCKNSEGAGFPFQVEAVEDRIDDSVDTGYVDKAYHGAGTASDFDEAALDDVGGAQLSPQMAGLAEEAQQLRQVALQLPRHGGIKVAPALVKAAAGQPCSFQSGGHGRTLCAAACWIDTRSSVARSPHHFDDDVPKLQSLGSCPQSITPTY